jgi:esterase/lipase superfamily enzyme
MDRVFFATNRHWDSFAFTEAAADAAGHYGMVGENHVQFMCRTSFLDATRPFARVFLFSHGFNNTFQSAVSTFLSYAFALQESGLSDTAFVLLSWPSEHHEDGMTAFFKIDSPYAADRCELETAVSSLAN